MTEEPTAAPAGGTAAPTPGRHRPGARFWLSAAVGWTLIAVGLRGILSHRIDTRPASLARFVIGGALVHDVLVAPVVILAGVAVARAVPRRVRPMVQGALVVTAVVALFSYPLVRGYARLTRNPTSLPHNYATNLAVVVGTVWGVAGLAAVVNVVRRARAGQRQAGS